MSNIILFAGNFCAIVTGNDPQTAQKFLK